MWRIQNLVGRVVSRCHGNAPLRLSQGHHVEDEVLNSSILSSGRHASDSSSSHGSHDQKKKRTSQFFYTGLPRYTALDAVGWGAAAVLFMQLCRRIHSRLSSHADQNPGPARIQKCSYKVLIEILSRPNALSGGVTVKCLQTPDSGSSDRSHGNGDGDVTSDLQTAHSSDDQQEEPESAASHCDETLFPEQLKPEEGVSLDAAAQNLRSVADASIPVILNIIGLESARAGAYEMAFSCFMASAQHDYSKAQFNLGVCYEKGRGAQTDLSKAVHYYRRAAAAGHRQAQYRCAKLLLNSRGQQSSETDAAAALNFLQAAADAGLTEAQVYLGVVLSQRPDCDEKKCVHYFRMAAESGDATALMCLAQCYETGFGVSPCVQTAVSLYHQAAARGNQRARDVLRDRHSRDVLRSIRSAPCFSVIGQLNLNSMFPQEKPRPQQQSVCQSQPLPHSWSTGSLSVSLQMLSAESSRKVWTLGVR
ncbi:death ligand signal enhancer isoform X2 [Sinocyclocheilus anshuiensis]|uniref:Death ligand signal enhancer n=1 Tax=Sinocyclocheilus anshuiensis TaxID=1608454 RepID=A0A671P876_9TELE|nr:PREDICTED: death ligand signal enhancer isoform X1 [Sinocyclocheilus anshuiensis]XP_016349579.1 PREDICTED: death ligand signal enhancer isoform X2 [Sinocyclocheilus anshuiensis]